jgi:hypothetical protein
MVKTSIRIQNGRTRLHKPLDDIKAARDIRFVIKDGIAYDSAELLQSAEGKIGPAGPNDHADWELEIRSLRKE